MRALLLIFWIGFFTLLLANTDSCMAGGGLRWYIDDKAHSFSWRLGN